MTTYVNTEPGGDEPKLLAVDYGDFHGDKAIKVFGYFDRAGVMHVTNILEFERTGIDDAAT